ncbi:MAG: hypothetical protein EPO11_07635 [Gammaproteobacteria bacterium]|nr:MAG: hypothetical protein EPO11_07635 [Gammaproteobacteria bacterium]
MFKKTCLVSTLCAALIPFSTFATEQATLHIVNETKVNLYTPSIAEVKVMEIPYEVCSHWPQQQSCPYDINVTIPVNENVSVDLDKWLFEDGTLSIDQSCKNLTITAKTGETKTMYLHGLPSNALTDTSSIVCNVI